MPTRKKKAASPPKKKRATRARRVKPKVEVVAASAGELAIGESDPQVAPIAEAVRADGGSVIGSWRDPLGGHPLLLATLPIDKVEPTSFQRDASAGHVRKLVHAIGKTGRFLDPLIVMRESDGRWLTPNGNHRLTAMRELGAKAITALIVPERSVAYQILALNTEKAHNLRERATEVRRMMIDLAGWAPGGEKDFELELDEPALVTLGFAYEERGRLAGGAYGSILRKVDTWIDGTLPEAVAERKRRAALLVELDDAVSEAVAKLKEQGLTSPYLKAFVVSRINPLRFIKGDPPSLDELLPSMAKRARGMDASKITSADVARSGGAPEDNDADG